jgi:hypothetical protein
MIGDLDQRTRRHDLEFGARPGGFGAAGCRANQTFLARVRPDRGRRNRAVEAEFAQYREAGKRVRRDGADRRHQAKRDRQVIMAAFFRQICRREIDGDAARGQRQPRSDQRGANPFVCLGDGLVRQADDGKGGQTRRDLHLHIDGAGLDALKRDGGNPLDHLPLRNQR